MPPARPSFDWDVEPVETGSVEVGAAALLSPAAPSSASLFGSFSPSVPDLPPPTLSAYPIGGHGGLDDLIAVHAQLNDVPVDLVHRVVIRESKYNPSAVGHGGALGLMQIKHATARALGYGGPAKGLLEAETNLTYAVKYLAGAYRTAHGNYDRAVAFYARGYYYAAKNNALQQMAKSGGRQSRRHSRGRSDVSSVADASEAVASNVALQKAAEVR